MTLPGRARFAVLIALLAGCAVAQAADSRLQTLDNATLVFSDEGEPPAAAAGAPVTLPDSWENRRPDATGYAWYLVDWTPPAQRDRICAVYLSVTLVPAEVYVNGRLVGATGALTGPRPRSWQQSQLFVVPASVMQDGVNHIAIRVYVRTAGTGAMGPILAGPEPALRKVALRDLFLHTLGPAITSVTIVVLGMFILVLWMRRRDPTYGLFGAAAVLWGLHTALSLLPQPFLPQPHWSIAWTTLYMLFVGLLCLFCVRFAQVDWPRYRRLVWGYVALAPVALYASYPLDLWLRTDTLIRLGGIGITVVALVAVARYTFARRDVESYLLLIAGGISAALGVHDWLAVQDPLAIRPPMLVPYAGLAFLLLVGWILTNRFVRALNEFESLNTKLEERVVEKSAALATQLEETRAARDAAEAADRAKSRFLAAASHDLRQPMHALQLFAARLGDRTHDADEAALVQRIQTCVGSLESLFSALLDISKLEAGVVTADCEAIALEPLFARIANDFGPEAIDKGLSLAVRPTAFAVRSDPVLLERIVRNLVANAIRYTQQGGVVIGARRRGERVSIEVWDTGPGIPLADQPRVFEEFYQVGNPERDRTRGLGLGLAIVRRLAVLLDHDVDMRSRPGRGSSFRVRAMGAPVSAIRVVPPPSTVIPDPLAGKRVVVIDDDETVREATRQTLVAWGVDPVMAGDVEEAIARCGHAAPDALVVDYRLRGGVDGIMAVKRMRDACAAWVPAIIVSGESSIDQLARIQGEGLTLLNKPVAPAKLRAALSFAIAGPARAAA